MKEVLKWTKYQREQGFFVIWKTQASMRLQSKNIWNCKRQAGGRSNTDYLHCTERYSWIRFILTNTWLTALIIWSTQWKNNRYNYFKKHSPWTWMSMFDNPANLIFGSVKLSKLEKQKYRDEHFQGKIHENKPSLWSHEQTAHGIRRSVFGIQSNQRF